MASPHFSTTHWSLIVQTGATPTSARRALEELCRRYWFPLYAFVRRAGHSEHEAQDLTQAFFARFLEKDYLHDVDRSRGKFRSFLLASLRHFLANAHDHARADKRGGDRIAFTLDFTRAEDRYLREPVEHWTPDKLFQRRWALEVLHAVLERLRAEWDQGDRRDFFQAVVNHVTGEAPQPAYAEVAVAFGMSEGAVKTAVHRLRRRYRHLLQEEISQTLADPSEVDEEIKQLFAALRGR